MCDEQDDSASANKLQVVSLKIFGEPASKANSRRLVRFGGMSRLIKSDKALSYSDMFRRQIPAVVPIEGDVRVTMHIWYASRRPDLDESLILDLMQGVAYVNDRQVKEKHIFWHLDPEQPRSEIVVEQLPVEKKCRVKRGKAKKGPGAGLTGPRGFTPRGESNCSEGGPEQRQCTTMILDGSC